MKPTYLCEEAQDPNTPPETLLKIVEVFPREVLENPVLAVLSLENPTLWKKIVYLATAKRLTQEAEQYEAKEPSRFEKWQKMCLLRALERYTPKLNDLQREEIKKRWESFTINSFSGLMFHRYNNRKKSEKALWRLGGHRLSESENITLCQEAATEVVLRLLFGRLKLAELMFSLASAAAYTEATKFPHVSTEVIEEARYTEARWLLESLAASAA